MGLFSALNTSLMGLNRDQNALSVVSQNIAGANQPGYVRRSYVDGGVSNGGVIGGEVRRSLDGFAQRQLWREISNDGFTSVQADFLKQLNALYGTPDSTATLPARFNDFSNALNVLRSDPGSSSTQSTFLARAKILADGIGTTANAVQGLRTSIEDSLSQGVSEVNDALSSLADINRQILSSPGSVDPSLLDNRDLKLQSLTELLEVSPVVGADGTVSITTKSGINLIDQASFAKFSFDARNTLSASDFYDSDPTKRHVGTISVTTPGGTSIDLIGSGTLRTGCLAGLVDLRDNVLVQAQSQLDDFAAGLSSALADRNVSGTAITNGYEVDLTGLQSGNSIHFDFTDSSGAAHHVSIVRVEDSSALSLPDSATADPNDKVIGVSFAGGVASALSAIQSGVNAIGGGLTFGVGSQSNALSITASSSAKLNSVSATITNTALQGQETALPVFVDNGNGKIPFTGSFDGFDHRIGLAGRLVVNPSLELAPSALVVYTTPSNGSNDPTRANALSASLSSSGVVVSQKSGLGLPSGTPTVSTLLQQIVQYQSSNTNRVTGLNDNQNVVLTSVQARFSSSAGVNMDQELTNLTQLQSAYTANARVMTAVKDMFDVLMRM